MTHPEAIAAIRSLAAGLEPDDAGFRRLLERISAETEPECLRDALIEMGAKALVEAASASHPAREIEASHGTDCDTGHVVNGKQTEKN